MFMFGLWLSRRFSPPLTDYRLAACLRREDILVVIQAFKCYSYGAKQCCHLLDTG